VCLSRLSRCKPSLATCSFCIEHRFGITPQTEYLFAALKKVGKIDTSVDVYGIKWCNWYYVLENSHVKYLRMINLPMTQGTFYVDKYTNISRSIFSHWSNRRYEMWYNVKPERDDVTGEWTTLHMRNLVMCTNHQTFRVIKSRRML